MKKRGIETDLVCPVDKGETVRKRGNSGTTRRVGEEKREMEGNGRIYIDRNYSPTPRSCLPQHRLCPPDIFPRFPFNSPPLRVSRHPHIQSWIMILTRPPPDSPTPSPRSSPSPFFPRSQVHTLSSDFRCLDRPASHTMPKCHQSHHLRSQDLSISTLDLPSFPPPPPHIHAPHLASPPPHWAQHQIHSKFPCAYIV
ncbi:hypothetical protein H4582DRAFT_1163659 [Lactarius indigo]|nr:hypothetical protein H4582DRAFT_1163659 [Lactarius indigo]